MGHVINVLPEFFQAADGERIVRTNQHLAKVRSKNKVAQFFFWRRHS